MEGGPPESASNAPHFPCPALTRALKPALTRAPIPAQKPESQPGAEQPVLATGASPGYDHAARWADALAEEAQVLASSSASVSSASLAD